MISQKPSANPIIIEPSTPIRSLTPPSLPTSSPDLSSSPKSLGSSRPQSQHSSSTSISDHSSETELDHIPKGVSDGQLPPPVSHPVGSSGPSTIQSPTSQPPRSEPSAAGQSPDHGAPDAGARWFPLESLSQRSQAIIGGIGLALTIVGLWFCVRSYKMGVWTMENDALQDCLNYIEVGTLPCGACHRC